MGAIQLFDQGQVGAALEMATVLLVPALKSLAELPCPGDEEVVERVREDWCNCLTHPSLSDGEAYNIIRHCLCLLRFILMNPEIYSFYLI